MIKVYPPPNHQDWLATVVSNSRVIVLAEVSTISGGRHVTADEGLHAIVATSKAADGYWMELPQASE